MISNGGALGISASLCAMFEASASCPIPVAAPTGRPLRLPCGPADAGALTYLWQYLPRAVALIPSSTSVPSFD
jgi:hypothetical protein